MIARAVALATLLALLVPATASAHAVLERTSPERGAALRFAPDEIAFFFSEPVEASFGAVRVFDAEGEQIETGELSRPDGRSDAIAARLPTELGDGTYTATYRVISADSHPVSGGFVFSVGKPGVAPAASVSELLEDSDAGPVTSAAYWAARFVGYAAIAFGVGVVVFLVAVWRPVRPAGEPGSAFAARTRKVLVAIGVAGIGASAAAVVLQGATASGSSFWEALNADTVGDVLDTNFGALTGIRAAAWALFIVAALSLRSRPRLALGLVAPALAYLVASPAFAGHADTQDPAWLLVPADVAHVTAGSVWAGGLFALVALVPAATRRLNGAPKSRLLSSALLRFSPLALASVVVLVAAGVTQSIVYVGPLADLIETGFGRAVLVKVAVVLALVGLGLLNRRRLLPALERLAGAGDPPGELGFAIRRSLRAEVLLVIGAFAATAALVSHAPPSQADAGPVSGSTQLGPTRLEYTVDPARVGPNQIHLYLFDADDGSQFRGAKEFGLSIALPAKEIGPLDVDLERAGPGHYVASGAAFGVAGEWTVHATLRLARFEQADADFDVEIK